MVLGGLTVACCNKANVKMMAFDIFFENDCLEEIEKDGVKKKFYLFRKTVKSEIWRSKFIPLPDCNILKGFFLNVSKCALHAQFDNGSHLPLPHPWALICTPRAGCPDGLLSTYSHTLFYTEGCVSSAMIFSKWFYFSGKFDSILTADFLLY